MVVIFTRECGLLPWLTCWPRLVQAGFPPSPLLLITTRTLAVGRKEEMGISRKDISIAPTLSLTTVLGRMVKHTESQDIPINRYAVENDKVFPMRASLHQIPRLQFVPGAEKDRAAMLPGNIKTGRFNINEDEIILKNWNCWKPQGTVHRRRR